MKKRIADILVFLCVASFIAWAFVRSPEGEYAVTLWEVFQEEGLTAAISRYRADHQPPKTQEPPRTQDPSQVAKMIEEDTEMIYGLINALRESLGLNTLEVDSKLAEMARYRAEILASIEEITHEIPGEGDPGKTFAKFGYEHTARGENLTNYFSDQRGDQAHKQFMDSKPHYECMIFPEFTKMGVGIAVAKNGMRYVCELFATPK